MAEDERYVEAVLSLVERIPVGRATTYGVLADAVGR
ncbi:MAG: MGMT family protein, partial [Nocardioidaceae bacterium]|nr:MGMT family protein [Nocardioidaceae bacterium]